MQCLGSPKVFSAQNVNVSGVINTKIAFGGAGVILYIVTSNPLGGPSFTFSISALNPDGSVGPVIITSPAVATATTTKLGVVLGAPVVANVMASDLLPGAIQITYTRGAGSFNIDVYTASFG